ncbi:MAG: hypothetical protein R3D43_01415 [Tepidamorphaceae bacterium]
MLETGDIAGAASRRRVAALLATLFLVVFAVRLFDVTQVSAATAPYSCGVEQAVTAQDEAVSIERSGKAGGGFMFVSKMPCHMSSCFSGCAYHETADVEIDLDEYEDRISFSHADQDLPLGIIHAAQPKPPRLMS